MGFHYQLICKYFSVRWSARPVWEVKLAVRWRWWTRHRILSHMLSTAADSFRVMETYCFELSIPIRPGPKAVRQERMAETQISGERGWNNLDLVLNLREQEPHTHFLLSLDVRENGWIVTTHSLSGRNLLSKKDVGWVKGCWERPREERVRRERERERESESESKWK